MTSEKLRLTKEEQLTAGKWYALGLGDVEGNIDWAGARLLKYEGDGYWSDEDGEVEAIFDPFLQAWVAPGAAEEFVAQS